MLITLKWLNEHIPDFQINDLDRFKHRLDTRLSEVEKVVSKGENLEKLVVAEVKSVEPHPSNKKLVVCTVDAGDGKLRTVVCGAPNVVVGMKSIFALPGAKVLDISSEGKFLEISERKMGDVTSQGMLCAPDEIGLSKNHAKIIELPVSTPIGTNIVELLKDVVIEIENKALPHRPDAFSHLGIAREISAIFKTKLVEKPVTLPLHRKAELANIQVINKVPELVKRYSGIVLSGVKVAPSPFWLQVRLSYAGINPVNNIVDITNYVMLDMGQPLHAFDLAKLGGTEIVVRKSRDAEMLTTLDHTQRALPAGGVVITCHNEIVALGGIMGGESSEIGSDTTDIFIESANFEKYTVRKFSRQLGLRTEGSGRFEKGIDPSITVKGLYKAVEMILEIAGGEIASDLIDIYPKPNEPTIIEFDFSSVKRILGIEVEKYHIVGILESLGFQVSGGERVSADMITREDVNAPVYVHVPSWRQDVNAQEDILEEIGRLYGYENAETTLPERDLSPAIQNKTIAHLDNLRRALVAGGMTEIFTYSMVGKELFNNAGIDKPELLEITNPISPELTYVRNDIVPSLLEKAQQNSAKFEQFSLFEVSKVAHAERDSTTKLPKQEWKLASIRVGDDMEQTYRQLKFGVESLSKSLYFGKLNVVPLGKNKDLPAHYHPGATGKLVLGDIAVGYIGIAHPSVTANFDLENKVVAVFNIDLDIVLQEVLNQTLTRNPYRPVSSFPVVERDISLWQSNKSYIGEVLTAVANVNLPFFKNISILDIFDSEKGRSITLRLQLQAADHTLETAEINTSVDKVREVITKLGHELRS